MNPGHSDISGSTSLVQQPEGGAEIEYSPELIQQIRAETVDAFRRVPHGGLEIAGVLFGTRLGRSLHLCAARAIDCEHARGPVLTLSDRDERELERLLAEARRDPALEGLEPLGWYVSHTRRPLTLAESDAAVFDRFFSPPMCLTAVVRPEVTGTAHFRVFARNEEGWVDPQQPSAEFTANPEPGNPRTQLPNSSEVSGPENDLLPEKFRNEDWIAPFGPVSHKEVRKQVRQIPLSNFSLIGAALLLLLFIAGAALWRLEMQPQVGHPLSLHVTESGQQLRIEWDPAAPAVRRATSGILEIKDLGDSPIPVRINIGPENLQTGSVLYSKPSDRVSIRLQLLDQGRHVSESMVYFLAREQPPAKVESPTPAGQTVGAAIPAVTERSEVIQKREPRPSAPADPRNVRATLLKTFSRPPVRTVRAPAPEPSAIEAPRIPIAPAQPVAALVGSSHTEVAPPPPVINATAKTETAKTPLAPTSGRLIWTGELRKGAVLKIIDGKASTGALNGALPQRPIKLSVHTAELLDGAIAIYTSDQNARQSAEAPSRRNGWNVTMYKWDPKRAHDVVMVETPGPGNDWKQLALKSVNRTTSVIVIDWQQAGN